MKIIKINLFLLTFVLINSCSILNQAGEYERFIGSSFTIENVEATELGGVDISELDDSQGLNAGDIMTLTGRLFSGNMPLKLNVFIEVYNINDKMAAISGMDWKFMMGETEYAAGSFDDRIEVEPYSKKVFKVKTQLNLLDVLNSESLPQIIKVARNINDEEEVKKLDIKLKIKPYYKTSSGIKKLPTYITLKP